MKKLLSKIKIKDESVINKSMCNEEIVESKFSDHWMSPKNPPFNQNDLIKHFNNIFGVNISVSTMSGI